MSNLISLAYLILSFDCWPRGFMVDTAFLEQLRQELVDEGEGGEDGAEETVRATGTRGQGPGAQTCSSSGPANMIQREN